MSTTPATTPADGELLPCPFCGNQPSQTPTIEQIEHDSWSASINCNECDISVTTQYTEPSEEGSILSVRAAWNRRATPSPGKADAEDAALQLKRAHLIMEMCLRSAVNGWAEGIDPRGQCEKIAEKLGSYLTQQRERDKQ